jgi:hypothetical protein
MMEKLQFCWLQKKMLNSRSSSRELIKNLVFHVNPKRARDSSAEITSNLVSNIPSETCFEVSLPAVQNANMDFIGLRKQRSPTNQASRITTV